jgi:isoleucyl-tRNA synthetase
MPLAANHYPFENKNTFNPNRLFGFLPKGYPADFIAEYIAQTRTWFYYMHVIGAALFGKLAFLNVVSTGTILAGDGSKMSKSKGNYTDPLAIVDQFGADALRFYLMGSVVMNGEDFNFKDEDVREVHNRVIGILWNCYKFFDLYKNEWDGKTKAGESTHVLDQWILSLLGKTITEVTRALEAYDTPAACKALRAFVDDYSTWYVRRSRDRVKTDADSSTELGADKQWALATQREVLLTVAQLLAPITPYIAEAVYRSVGGEKDSVHLTRWPEALSVKENLLTDMTTVREIASAGLKEREKAGLKIRQPLTRLSVRVLPQDPALHTLIAEEINVKEIFEDASIETPVHLDTTLTPALMEEGAVRSLVRRVQEWRKQEGFTITDRPSYILVVTAEEKAVAEKYHKEIIKDAGLSHLEIVETPIE